MRIGSLCSGYGGLDEAVQAVLGGELAWVADLDPGAAAILAHRYPDVPNLGDITAVDWSAVEPVDILGGGYPCQPFSDAGLRKGTEDERHIWPYIACAIRVLRPRFVVLENVRGHLGRGFDTVLADLAALGFDAEWCTATASDVGAPHRRERLFVLAWPAPDSDRAARGERRLAASGEAEGGRSRADAGGRGGAPAADAPGDRRHEGRPEPARVIGGPDAPFGGDDAPTDADVEHLGAHPGTAHGDAALDWPEHAEPTRGSGAPAADWGSYGPAIRRWERVTGRLAPRPTEPGRTGERLSPRFVEFLMGLPEGWVTDVPGLSRNAMLKALGNGVVPQQAELALRLLLERAGFTGTEAAA